MQNYANRAREAWQAYTSRGAIRKELLRSEIYRAWRRAHYNQVNPLLSGPDVLDALETERLIDAQGSLLQAAAPYLSAITTAAGSLSHAVLLATPAGIVIDRRGDAASLNGPTPTPPLGALMGESYAGANGIGTPLAENAYVELHGAEHFIHGFQDHHCLGIPLRGADDDVAGVLCLSTNAPQTGYQLRGMLLTAARGIESELRALKLRDRLTQLAQDASQAAKSVALIHQDVVQSHAAARLQIQMGALQMQRGHTSAIVQDAEHSLARFLRSARTWQLASGLPLSAPMLLPELTENVAELMQTEAKMQRVDLRLGAIEATARSPVTPRFARLALMETGHALRAVSPGGFVELNLLRDGTLLFQGRTAYGGRRLDRRARFDS